MMFNSRNQESLKLSKKSRKNYDRLDSQINSKSNFNFGFFIIQNNFKYFKTEILSSNYDNDDFEPKGSPWKPLSELKVKFNE